MFTSFDDVEDIDLLRPEDQQMIREYVERSVDAKASISVISAGDCAIEVSQTSRAGCKHCSEKIMKGTVSILSDVFYFKIYFQFVCCLWYILFLGLPRGVRPTVHTLCIGIL